MIVKKEFRYDTALWSSQKDIQETDTVMEQGTYTVTMKKDNCRAKSRSTRRQEYSPENIILIKESVMKSVGWALTI